MSAVTTEDIKGWIKQLTEAGAERQYKIYRYCPHLNRLVALLDFPSECWKCDSEILRNHLENQKPFGE